MESERISLSNCPRELKKSVEAISILVVDDDTTCLSIVAAILKKFKYQVVTVKHANDALCTLRIKGGSAAFDLVVSDVHMPDINGFQLQQAIAQEFNLPVVLMSADQKESVALKGLESGAAFFIYKPVSPDDVRDLWQFAAMKKNNKSTSSQVVIEEKNNNSCNETTTILSVSAASSVNELDRVLIMSNNKDDDDNDDSKIRKCPKKDEKEGEAAAAAQKKPKVIWTNSLHNSFLEAIRSIGLDRAVPKKILEVMNVPGLTRENVASHLQKYRMFLRRVSDASYKIQYCGDKGINMKLLRSSLQSSSAATTTSPSTLMLNKFPYHHQLIPNYTTHLPTSRPAEASSSLSSTSLIIAPSSSSSGFGLQSRLLSTINNTFQTHINNIVSHEQLEDLCSPSTTALLSPTFDTHQDLACQTTNYVGYSISNIKHPAAGDQSVASDQELYNTININGDDDDHHHHQYYNSFVVENHVLINSPAGEQLSDVISDYRFLPLNSCGVEQLSGLANYSPMFDIMSSELDALEEGTLADHDQQPQPQQNEDEASTTSNFYGGTNTTTHWNNYVSSFDQPPNQQQVCEGIEFGTSFVSPIELDDDDHFLESLLARFGEDHILQGI